MIDITKEEREKVDEKLRFISGNAHKELMEKVAGLLGEDILLEAKVNRFPDREVSVHIKETIRDKKVWVGQPICSCKNSCQDKNLMELLLIIDAAKRASAAEVNVFVPYYGYARQDRKDKGRVPISAKLVANLIARAGADRILTYDLHAGQIQGFFDIPVDNLKTEGVAAKLIIDNFSSANNIVVVAPDSGSRKKVSEVRGMIEEHLGRPISVAVMNKKRESGEDVEVLEIVGPVEGKICVMVDDMISTFGSMYEGAKKLKESGASEIHAVATHGLFVGDAWARIKRKTCPVESITTSNTVPLNSGYGFLPESAKNKLNRVDIAEHSADVIMRIFLGKSVSAAFRHS